MAKTYSEHLLHAAGKLSTVGFGFSVKRDKWDREFWEETGTRQKGAKVLRLIPGKSATEAVKAIFTRPGLWSFDCSQFCQVVNFYAQMMTLNESNPRAFDRQIEAHGNRLEIKPFHGAYFTVREHYYRREKQTEWMKYKARGSSMPYVETTITAWDLVRAAPVGTRVNFNVGAGGAFNYENTVKANMNPLQFLAQGLGSTKVWDHDDLLVALAGVKDPRDSDHTHTVEEAAKIIWIKEVSIFQNLSLPPHRRT